MKIPVVAVQYRLLIEKMTVILTDGHSMQNAGDYTPVIVSLFTETIFSYWLLNGSTL